MNDWLQYGAIGLLAIFIILHFRYLHNHQKHLIDVLMDVKELLGKTEGVMVEVKDLILRLFNNKRR